MADNEIPATVLPAHRIAARSGPRASLTARLVARLRAGSFDRQIAVGVRAPAGSAIAAHAARLVSATERERVARSLRQAVADARGGGPLMSSRVALHIPNVTAAEPMI